MYSLYLQQNKFTNMISPLAIAGVQLAGHAFGQYQSSKAGKDKRKYNEELMRENEAWWKGEYNRDPTELTQNRAFLKQIQNQYTDALKASKQSAVKRGATPEAQVAAGSALSGKYADAVNKLVSGATAYRQNIDRTYRSRKQGLEGQKRAFWQEEQQSWGNFGNNVAQTGAGLLKAYGTGDFDKTKKTEPDEESEN